MATINASKNFGTSKSFETLLNCFVEPIKTFSLHISKKHVKQVQEVIQINIELKNY